MKVNNGKVICPTTGNKITQFEAKYGCHVKDFARAEGTTPAAIHMRVMKWDTPYQRRARPTACEILTGYSKRFIVKHVGYDYNNFAQKMQTRQGLQDVMNQLFEYGPFCQTEFERKILDRSHPNLTAHDKDMYIESYTYDKWSWLMPEHPDYDTWRYEHTVMLLENKYGNL